jgi:hypothetical protein
MYMPTAQSMQVNPPAPPWYCPAAHGSHAEKSTAEGDVNCPAAQSAHAVEPGAPWYWP